MEGNAVARVWPLFADFLPVWCTFFGIRPDLYTLQYQVEKNDFYRYLLGAWKRNLGTVSDLAWTSAFYRCSTQSGGSLGAVLNTSERATQ